MERVELAEIYRIVDEVAPFALSKEYIARGMYDNSGVLLECDHEIHGVLFSLDLSCAAVEEAKKRGANLIITHHPAIWEGVKQLTCGEAPALVACVQAGISVISAHLNLDAAKNGIDESLMHGLGGDVPLAVMESLSCGGYGRVYNVPPCSLEEFVAHTKTAFSTERVVVYGKDPVKRVASFCGGGFTSSATLFALSNGADTLVSSDAKHHLILEAVEKGLNVVLLTHYASENYGFTRFAETIKNKLWELPCAIYTDERFL